MSADRELFALARAQHGVVASRQLVALGIGRARISTLSARGWLRPVHRGVYLVGPIHGPRARLMAGTLAVGEGAVVSHRSAAEVWGLGPALGGAVAVTTAPGRSVLDLATQLSRRDLARAVEEAEVLTLLRGDWLQPLLTRNQRHRGASALRAVTQAADAPAMTRSEAERRLLELVRAARLPSPETNRRIHGYEVDFVWSAQKLVVEVDGYAFHSSRTAFERDRRRDADLVRTGFRVIRITWRQLTLEPEAVVALLTRALAS